jgi:hypothetical protein
MAIVFALRLLAAILAREAWLALTVAILAESVSTA